MHAEYDYAMPDQNDTRFEEEGSMNLQVQRLLCMVTIR